ncbi:MAG: metallophosphoesterase [Lactobacillaceae bacterium]|jgi:putative phosphoesterase|nr:metallophosphoesterase [Lactobacillaceae bacterium]
MDYLIVSDTHGDRDILEKIVQAYQGKIRAMFYNGDSELAADDELFHTLLPVIGNMDFDSMFPDDRNYVDSDIKIYQTHGHLYHTERDLNQIRTKATQLDADVITLGHTHQLGAEMIDGKLFINPGSISLPKGQFAYLHGTYAILSVEPNEFKVQFYTRELQPVPSLNFSFSRIRR